MQKLTEEQRIKLAAYNAARDEQSAIIKLVFQSYNHCLTDTALERRTIVEAFELDALARRVAVLEDIQFGYATRTD